MSGFHSKVIGDKRRYRQYKAREQLPAGYRTRRSMRWSGT